MCYSETSGADAAGDRRLELLMCQCLLYLCNLTGWLLVSDSLAGPGFPFLPSCVYSVNVSLLFVPRVNFSLKLNSYLEISMKSCHFSVGKVVLPGEQPEISLCALPWPCW